MVGLRLDETRTRNSRFSARAADPWSKLRRSYTGPRMAFNLIFLAAFFVPFFLKTAGWVAAYHVQAEVRESLTGLQEVAAILDGENHPEARSISAVVTSLSEQLPRPGSERWRESRVWRLVFGLDREPAYWLSAIALLLYNVLRWMLTGLVAPMRDEEERSGVSPAWKPPRPLRPKSVREWLRYARDWLGSWAEAYGWLVWPHRAVRSLAFVAIGSFSVHAVHWLSLPVWLPAAG